MAELKKCPMCAEQIPLDAATCEFCGSRFEVTSQDGKLVSRFISEAAPAPAAPPVQPAEMPVPASPPTARSNAWAGWAIGGVVVVGLLVVSGFLLFRDLLNFPGFAPTTTPTRRPVPTSMPNYAATVERRNEEATATAQAGWVQGFAQPILDEVANHAPNFEDDFSVRDGCYVRWSSITSLTNVTFEDGVMHMDTTGVEWAGAGGSLMAVNFVLEFDFTPRVSSDDSGVFVNFRATDDGFYNFGFDFYDFWWGMGSLPAGEEYRMIADGWSEEVGLDRTTSVIIIAQGNRFAFYANGRPLSSVLDAQYGGDWVDMGVYSTQGTAKADIDNVKFWDLDNLK